jgi:hypothetical protein
MRRLLNITVIVGAVVVALIAFDKLPLGNAAGSGPDTATSSEVRVDHATPGRIPAPDGKSVAVCIDPTASTDRHFARSIRASLVEAVRGYVPHEPAETKAGIAPVAGLDLTVRLVSTRPLAYGEPYLYADIPLVAGLPTRPDMTQLGALEPGGPYLAWKKSNEQWAADYHVAVEAQSDAIDALGRIDLSYSQRSGVRDCVAALMTVPFTSANVTVVVASDLRDNEFTGTAPDFGGARMLLIQPCPNGNASECARRYDAFISWASAHGVGPVSMARPEAADTALGQLISVDR